ncbi:MAG TPA: glucose-1-phosphate adenylyltransferase [Candidatus Ratteibacteria bacterium]|uniref:Glucose-1-phosphate adenylyltransferase n=1 Tax=candidate division TA06 bacterium ADurb.Bin131 TaxID=1852827 RepID=A0A1V6CAE8_UNCT6|nr:MAG: Glucose-1-phosphate adenylyltransferase [candidate division TA06 bacterium ADurb.Bin131]HOC02037.1 glucose-1-phosphate adenylyltransferase [bacterium]HON05392.1 glucose-1-phosphate adenylyltransferase [bacterium]HRS06198.1 glucose-1-phosphate adenylyltransferase [Candidatus Ratteibacteria bacterium]HRV04339.1 glucose-1-phosphate adenylyltransferase [Candidatus Ratteibacteria bacterium]
MPDREKILTLVLAGGKGERLYPLTRDRAKPSVPFGGTYRIIDFTLSNAINSGLRKIYVLIQYKSYSLQRHIREGWNIFSRELGEFVDVVPAQMRIGTDWYLGTADSVFQNIYFLNQEKPDMVLILSGDHVYKMDYRRIIEFHKKNNADLTVSVFEVPIKEAKRFGVVEINQNNEIQKFEEKPETPKPSPNNPDVSLISMGIYLFNTETLIRRIVEDAKKPESTHDFGKDVIPSTIGKDRVFAFPFIDENKKETKYWRDIGTIEAYYEANMDLVNVEPVLNLYDSQWPIRTFQEQLPPVKTVFSFGERTGMILDSIVGGGCIISGGKVIRSVLSPWVRINSYADVSESILLNNVNIGRYCKIRKTIIDKNVSVPQGTIIGYDPVEDKKRFFVSETGIAVIPKDYQW